MQVVLRYQNVDKKETVPDTYPYLRASAYWASHALGVKIEQDGIFKPNGEKLDDLPVWEWEVDEYGG